MTAYRDMEKPSPLLRKLGNSLLFWCPGCNQSHQVRVEGHGAWGYNNIPELPTFTPSVKVTYDANPKASEEFKEWRTERICHSYVTAGMIEFLSDSTHGLKGQTVPLPVFPK